MMYHGMEQHYSSAVSDCMCGYMSPHTFSIIMLVKSVMKVREFCGAINKLYILSYISSVAVFGR